MTFLRQYGAREYGITLAIAAIAGIALAVLINSGPGAGGDPALLRTAPQPVAKTTSGAPEVAKKRHPVVRHHRAHRPHTPVAPPPTPTPVVRVAPKPKPPAQATAPTTTTDAAPVVRSPAPAPKPAPKPAPPKDGGGIQFDDSG